MFVTPHRRAGSNIIWPWSSARGITVNTIAPGAVATDSSGGLLRDGNHWVTGQRIEVSGGMHL